MLPMGSSTLIKTAIHAFQSIGIKTIIVITGYRAEIPESHVVSTGAMCLWSDYMHNKMFDSASIGLQYVEDKCGMTFFTALGAELLDDLGHTGISSIVRAHKKLDEYDVSHITEKSVVYLAGRLVNTFIH